MINQKRFQINPQHQDTDSSTRDRDLHETKKLKQSIPNQHLDNSNALKVSPNDYRELNETVVVVISAVPMFIIIIMMMVSMSE